MTQITRILAGTTLALTILLGSGCAGHAQLAAANKAVELTLHDVTADEAQTYATELRASGRYQSVEVRIENASRTARIVARTVRY